MIQTRRAIIIAVVAVMFLTLPLGAQESNTNKATAGLFGNDVDDYMDYHSWSDVNFDKWFAFAGWNNSPSLGYAMNLNEKIYLGAWFNGNIVRVGNGVHSETITPAYDPVNQIMTSTTTVTSFANAQKTATNEIAVLVGLRDLNMAIKAGFAHNLIKNKLDGNRDFTVLDTQDGFITYTNEPIEYIYRPNGNFIRPYVGWGGIFGSIKPYATIGINIFTEKQFDSYKSYTTGASTGVETVTYDDGYSRGYVMPDLTLGAFYELQKGEDGKWDKTISAEYNINFKAYNNDYGASGIDGSVKGTASWAAANATTTRFIDRTVTAVDQTVDIEEISDWQHSLTPSFTMSSEVAPAFKLGFSAGLPIILYTKSTDSYSEGQNNTETIYHSPIDSNRNTATETKTHTPDSLVKETTFGIGVELSAGASYQLIPNRFTINAGIKAEPIGFMRTSTKTSPNGSGTVADTNNVTGGVTTTTTVFTPNVSDDDSAEVDAVFSEFSYSARGGFTFSFNNNAAVDMSIVTSGANGNLNLTNITVLFIVNF